MLNTATFFGCDWGSTAFRLRLVEAPSRRVLGELSAPAGVKTFTGFPAAERSERMGRYLAGRPILITGMASSNVGWKELPYAMAPFPLDGSSARAEGVEFTDTAGRRRRALLCSGARTADDVMRGEECALIGAGTLRPELAAPGRRARCLLAGTHPKHALLCDGALQNFRALLTGELFEVLARESLLAASVTHEVAAGPPDLAMFRAGVACARERGAEAALFQVRARHLLLATAKEANTWFLSGVLVGGELSRLECEVVGATLALIGDPMRLTLYCAALEELGLAVRFGAPILIALNDAVVAGQEKLMRAHAHQLAA